MSATPKIMDKQIEIKRKRMPIPRTNVADFGLYIVFLSLSKEWLLVMKNPLSGK